MRKSLVSVGDVYAKLRVVSKVRPKYWLCICECGKEKVICSSSLLRGDTRSCGCYKAESAAARHVSIIGRKVGRLLVIAETFRMHQYRRRFECRCDCGQTTFVEYDSLASARTRSCGCLRAEMQELVSSHSKKRHPLYVTWIQMLNRCYCPKNTSYKNYGKRGIKVCDRWHSFENFIADMSNRPSGTMIERINNDGDYEPSNCKWGTPVEQVRNRRNTVSVEFRGELRPLGEWCEILQIPYKVVHARIHRYGWSLERALTTPVLTASEAGKLQC